MANEAYAKTDYTKPVIKTKGDIFAISPHPTTVPFLITAYDDVDGKVNVDCDKSNKTVFQVGKTTVRCYAVDKSGNVARTSFVVTIGDNFVVIPEWFKLTTQYWTSNMISDSEYTSTVQYLLQQKIIYIPMHSEPNDSTNKSIPKWIKTSSQNWVNGKSSTDEFSLVIQWMLERGLVLA